MIFSNFCVSWFFKNKCSSFVLVAQCPYSKNRMKMCWILSWRRSIHQGNILPERFPRAVLRSKYQPSLRVCTCTNIFWISFGYLCLSKWSVNRVPVDGRTCRSHPLYLFCGVSSCHRSLISSLRIALVFAVGPLFPSRDQPSSCPIPSSTIQSSPYPEMSMLLYNINSTPYTLWCIDKKERRRIDLRPPHVRKKHRFIKTKHGWRRGRWLSLFLFRNEIRPSTYYENTSMHLAGRPGCL